VQEDERLLAEHDEYRVAQLRQFAEHEEPGPEAAHAILLDVAVGEDTEYRSVIGHLHTCECRNQVPQPYIKVSLAGDELDYIYIERLERISLRRDHNTNLGTQTEWKSP